MSCRQGASKGGRTLFTQVLEDGAAKARRKTAPAARAHAGKRRKAPTDRIFLQTQPNSAPGSGWKRRI
jgi:hypothetical protein